MSGQQQQQLNASAMHPDYQHPPLVPEVEAIFQQRLHEERAAWEHERGSPEYTRSQQPGIAAIRPSPRAVTTILVTPNTLLVPRRHGHTLHPSESYVACPDCKSSVAIPKGYTTWPVNPVRRVAIGPYHVSRVLGLDTAELEEMDGKRVPRTWHASKLRKFYC
ncbi:hypothetical protein LIER_09329 [Lithospermum erythrorhizon]|uniref:Uncharacterized protein n=1 Tax=Lithospermum erythrorhizon TaxID=34254 RepID=A0AAV3PGH2_LITER